MTLRGIRMTCPNCGSDNISGTEYIETETERENCNTGNACCGTLLLGWPGLLCGFCRRNEYETVSRKVSYYCNECGHQWTPIKLRKELWE